MVLKQLLIDEQRHEALKQRAKALRISEDELLRRAIDGVLTASPAESAPPDRPDRAAKIMELLEAARVLAEGRREAEPYELNRDELHEERESRWTRHQ